MLNIAVVVPTLDKGGLEQVAFNLFNEYRKAGHKCVFLVEKNECGEIADKIDTEDYIVFAGERRIFVDACISRGVDVLHYHYSVFMIKEMSEIGINCIYTVHNTYTWLSSEEFLARVEKIRCASVIIAVSSWVADYFCKRGNFDRSFVKVISNGVSFQQDVMKTSEVTRHSLGIPEHVCLFVNIASLHQVKHQALIVHAVAKIVETRSDFVIALVGHDGEPDYANFIRKLIQTLAVQDHIKLLGNIPHNCMPFFYQDIVDFVLLPSLTEGNSNVVLEALYYGVPMILSDVGLAREAAEISKLIHLIPRAYDNILDLTPEQITEISRNDSPKNIEPLVRAIDRAIDNHNLCFRDRECKKAASVGTFSSSNMAISYLEVIHSLTAISKRDK